MWPIQTFCDSKYIALYFVFSELNRLHYRASSVPGGQINLVLSHVLHKDLIILLSPDRFLKSESYSSLFLREVYSSAFPLFSVLCIGLHFSQVLQYNLMYQHPENVVNPSDHLYFYFQVHHLNFACSSLLVIVVGQ